MFGFLKKKGKIEIGAPVKGQAVPLSDVSDPVFGEGMMGQGMAIRPSEGRICAPADGEISLLFDTLHAVSMTTTDGVEILVHVGLDTVALKGEHFTAHVKTGDTVKKGDLLLEVDFEQIKAAGYDTITPVIICNTDDYASVDAATGKSVVPGDVVLELTQK